MEEGSSLARNVYVSGNRVPSLRQGIKLTNEYLNALEKHGIKWVYIEDAVSEGIEVYDVIYEDTRVMANSIMAQILSANPPNLSRESLIQLHNCAQFIVADIKEYKPRVTIELWNLKTLKDYLFLHSVNVAVISALIGWRMGFNNQELEDITMGVLLHDVGKVTISERIHNKPGSLTVEEFAEMKKHTERGFNFLRERGAYNPTVWSVAHQHHEAYDGSGYPNNRKGKEIHLYSRIAAIADVFDALTSDRPYKNGWAFHKVLNLLTNGLRHKFDPKALSTFVDLIPLYPKGTAVKLSTGEMGMIKENREGNYHRPIVRIVIDAKGKPLDEKSCYDLDLSKETDIKIIENMPT